MTDLEQKLLSCLPEYSLDEIRQALPDAQGGRQKSLEQIIAGIQKYYLARMDVRGLCTENEIIEHSLRVQSHRRLVLAREWRENAEGWRVYAEHLEEVLEQQQNYTAWALESADLWHDLALRLLEKVS